MGSSPLTRGKLRGELEALPPRGLIPAHAGKTSQTPETVEEMPGSSPLTRGKHRPAAVCLNRTGLIPAHAGKTQIGYFVPGTVRAHPRSRGENADVQISTPNGPGSSPLTRGKRCEYVRFFAPRGLIPAHAGKTSN